MNSGGVGWREFERRYIITTEGVGVWRNAGGILPHETLHELMAVDTCTEAQRRRFLLYALDGLVLQRSGVLWLLQSGCLSKCGGGQKKIYKIL